jgi:hypothetical protein
MYPLRDNSLPLAEVAKHWARDFPQRPPREEIEDQLLPSAWKGRLVVLGGNDMPLTLEALLRIVSIVESHPGILIVRHPDALRPDETKLPDGSVLVDAATRVYLPVDDALWTADIVAAACADLAQCKISDYDASVVRPIFEELEIRRDDFAAFCDALGYERPPFWFGTPRSTPRGFPGRPSMMAQLQRELRRRADQGLLEQELGAEAKALHAWAKRAFAGQQIPGFKSIENGLRTIYWALRGKPDIAKAQKH